MNEETVVKWRLRYPMLEEHSPTVVDLQVHWGVAGIPLSMLNLYPVFFTSLLLGFLIPIVAVVALLQIYRAKRLPVEIVERKSWAVAVWIFSATLLPACLMTTNPGTMSLSSIAPAAPVMPGLFWLLF